MFSVSSSFSYSITAICSLWPFVVTCPSSILHVSEAQFERSSSAPSVLPFFSSFVVKSQELAAESGGCEVFSWLNSSPARCSLKSRLTLVLRPPSAVEFKCRVNRGTQILKLSLKWFEEQTVLWQAGREYVNSWPPAVLRARSLKGTNSALRLTEMLLAPRSLKSWL